MPWIANGKTGSIAEAPPSTYSSWPVMKLACSVQRSTTAFPTSAGTPAPGGQTGSWQPWVAMGSAKSAKEALARYFSVALAPKGPRMQLCEVLRTGTCSSLSGLKTVRRRPLLLPISAALPECITQHFRPFMTGAPQGLPVLTLAVAFHCKSPFLALPVVSIEKSCISERRRTCLQRWTFTILRKVSASAGPRTSGDLNEHGGLTCKQDRRECQRLSIRTSPPFDD
jgi:hypothetical protein